MRRLLSILLLAILGLGPAMAEVPARGLFSGWTGKVDESHVPVCCRRGGKHHCAMNATEDGERAISANEPCPCAPRGLVSTAPTIAAMAAAQTHATPLAVTLRGLRAGREAAFRNERRARPKRGPPQNA